VELVELDGPVVKLRLGGSLPQLNDDAENEHGREMIPEIAEVEQIM